MRPGGNQDIEVMMSHCKCQWTNRLWQFMENTYWPLKKSTGEVNTQVAYLVLYCDNMNSVKVKDTQICPDR